MLILKEKGLNSNGSMVVIPIEAGQHNELMIPARCGLGFNEGNKGGTQNPYQINDL